KREYIGRYGITARHFNALAIELKAKVKAAEEAHRNHLVNLRGQIQSTERAIAKLQKQEKALASGKGRWAALPPEERAKRRRRVRFRLHQKKRRLAMLRARLEAAEARAGSPPICFGSRRLFHRQFHLEANGFASHDAWRRHGAMPAAKASSVSAPKTRGVATRRVRSWATACAFGCPTPWPAALGGMFGCTASVSPMGRMSSWRPSRPGKRSPTALSGRTAPGTSSPPPNGPRPRSRHREGRGPLVPI